MITLGLTGNRYSGKTRVADTFKQIQIPVFDADTVLKFILNYNYELLGEMKTSLGGGIFTNIKDNELRIDMKRLSKHDFDKVLDFVEDELFDAYNRFNLKAKKNKSIYTIFHSSFLFEKKWDKKLDMVINVFAPETDRMKRCKYNTNMGLLTIKELASSEMDGLEKNKMADFVIQNPNDGSLSAGSIPGRTPSSNILKQVNQIDQKIIDEYLYKENLNFVM